MAWNNVQKQIVPYLLRIETQDGSGTGFLFAYNEDKSIAAFATAAHVVEQAHDWKQPIKLIHHESGDDVFLTDKERVIFLDRRRDSASILVRADALKLPASTLPLMDPTKYKRVGVEIAWTGFPSVAYPELCFFTGCVSAFLTRDDCYLIDGVAINGVSGGPVFADFGDKNHTPEIIGSVSAYMPNRVGGTTLPGLLRAQDIAPFQETIKTITSMDEAKRQEREATKKAEEEKAQTPRADQPQAPDAKTEEAQS